MKRLLVALLLLALPLAGAAEPEDGPALWREQMGDDGVVSVGMGAPVQAGEPIRGHIRFHADYPVVDVQYQICRVGEACFAVGIPTERMGQGDDMPTDGTVEWRFDTADLPLHTGGRPVPTTYAAGERIGIQFFVFLEGMAEDEPLLFPQGLPDDHPWTARNGTQEEYVAWSETHYFAVTIQPGEKATPGLGVMGLVTLLGALAFTTRRRRNGEA